MLSLDFACTACGRCCHGSFSATLDEALRLAGEAPLAIGLMHTNGPARNPSAAQARAERRWVIQCVTGDNRTVHIAPTIGTLRLADRPCVFLTPERLCRLEGDGKPLRCRAMPLPRGTEPGKGVYAATTEKCPPEVHDGPPLLRSGRVVDPGYARAAGAELDALAADLKILAPALLYAARVFAELGELVEGPQRRSDLFAASPAFAALAAYGLGRWPLDAAAGFCEAQAAQLARAAAELGATDPGFARRVGDFASAARVVGRDLRAGGGYSLENWRGFMAEVDLRP